MNDLPIPPELAARITAAAAVLGDYQRAAPTAGTAERAMWGARLADALESLLDGLGGAGPGPVSPSPAGDGSAGHPGNRTGHTAETPAAAGASACHRGVHLHTAG